ncbi:MAG TPA: sulfatase-like hydrolase/transferase [Thermoanaerobaculia bacterium]|nr:sulfatase-like hydrolase/transferase [Thermoanaerobaculia bacterium]
MIAWTAAGAALGTALLLGTALGLAGCGGDRETFEKAPILLISIDTLRSDHLPAYGYKGVETPALDGLRRDAILFERAYSHVPLTLPSHASILTGLLPPEHGVRDNGGYPFEAAKHPYLPRLLAGAGYDTAAFVSSFVLHSQTGLGAGFGVYDQGHQDEEARAELIERPGAETVRAAIEWLDGRSKRSQEIRTGERPFFLFVHLYDPHTPYKPAEPFAARYPDRPYDGEIAASDAAVGTLLDALKRQGIYDKAIVVLLSDHGEGLGDHGEDGHGILLYREALQVPLLLKLPGGQRAGTSVAAPAQLADVAPTLLRLTGRPVPREMHGQSLVDLADRTDRSDQQAAARRIYSETFYPRLHLGWSELASLIEGRHHYIHGPAPELFDLAADPGETQSVLERERRIYGTLRQALDAIPREIAPPGQVDAETAQKLAALGYAGRARMTSGPLPDPRTQRDVLKGMQDAKTAVAENRFAEAAEILERLVERKPDLLDGWVFLATCREHLDQPEETLAAYRRALELADGAPEYAFYVARQLYKMRRFDEARQHAELMLASDPGNRDAREMLAAVALNHGDLDEALAQSRRAGRASEAFRRDLGRALAARGRTAEALELLQASGAAGGADPATLNTLALTFLDAGRPADAAEVLGRVLAAHPDNARAHELLGVAAMRLGQPRQARAHLEKALQLDRRLPAAWTTLGVALYDLEGPDAALSAWRQALALDGTQYDALLNVGLVAAQTGRRDEARQALRRFVSTAPPQRFGPDIAKAQQLLREIGG